MSRARVHEVSSPISLFPFIGILLCTMGALLVVLVAVSRSARDSAQHQMQASLQSTATVDEGIQKKMDYVQQYIGNLRSVHDEAERKLRDEHSRLSHVEDHIRRLHEQMRSLQLAAAELEAMEKEHYDDRAQAEREVQRLNQLIDESRKTITSLQNAADQQTSSYAVVPYEGPNGTFRRPIYIECVKDGIILQPEGIHITADDLRPPYGAGNPLASVIRASRDNLVRLYPKEGQRRDLEPYPLLLVRSEGLVMFDRARQAIEAGDFDLGFELVENDWNLKFPPPDPQLATVQQLALEQSRARQEVLAAAAPRAYRGVSMSNDDDYADDDEPDYGAADASYGGNYGDRGASGGGFGREGSSGFRNGGWAGSGLSGGGDSGRGPGGGTGEGVGGQGNGAVAGGPGGSKPGGGGQDVTDGSDGNAFGGSYSGADGGIPGVGGGGGSPGSLMADAGSGDYASSGGSGAIGGGATGTGGGANGGSAFDGGGSPAAASADPGASPDANRQQNVSMTVGSPPRDAAPNFHEDAGRGKNQASLAEARGKDWALRQKTQRATPVRRTIRVVVRDNQLTILPDDAPHALGTPAGTAVSLQGDTVQSLDEFVKQVRDQIDGWGMAGNGLYWRPVILLTVGPNGQRRADDLQRLLRNSGLELRTDETANHAPQGTLR
jgi:hypothetical protein